MEKVHPWCVQSSDRGRLKNRTEQNVSTVRFQCPQRLRAGLQAVCSELTYGDDASNIAFARDRVFVPHPRRKDAIKD